MDFTDFFQKNKVLLKEYLEVRLELLKLQGVKFLSKTAGLFTWLMVILFLVFFILLFLGMMFAWWIADLTHSNIIGFASAAGIFVVLLMICFLFRKSLFQKPIAKLVIKEALEEDEEDQNTKP